MEKGKIQLTQKDAENTPAGGVVVGKRDGQTMIYDDASLGGYFVGKLHKDGGIKMINKSTGQPLEVQGSEIIITAPAVNDQTKREFEGKMMTNREILSKINSDGGGVSFADGGDIPAKIHTTDCEYKLGGKVVKDTDIAHSLGMNSTLKKGKQQFSSGDSTYDVDAIYNAIKKGKLRLKTKEVKTFPMKYPVYDKKYSETVKTDFRKPNGITVRTESGEEVLIDGNHRMNNAYLKGRKTMKTYYIEDPKQISKFTKKNKFELGGENKMSGHFSKGKSLKQIAEMHNVSLTHINEELSKGLEVEKEHFADFKERTRVAKDHLVENPNYYTILEKAGLKGGGHIQKQELVENSKKGDTPARDLNNYNDIMDLEADGMVGMESGLAFAKGGLVTKGNLKNIEKEFLALTDNSHYKGIYDEDEINYGVALEWGKYGYSVSEDQQEEDYKMLKDASTKFNAKNIGKLYANAEFGDKFNTVTILDYDMLANDSELVSRLPEKYFAKLKVGRIENRYIAERIKEEADKLKDLEAVGVISEKLGVTKEKADNILFSLKYDKEYYEKNRKQSKPRFDVFSSRNFPRKDFENLEQTLDYIQSDAFANSVYMSTGYGNPISEGTVHLFGKGALSIKYKQDDFPFKPDGSTDFYKDRTTTLKIHPYLAVNVSGKQDFMTSFKKGISDFIWCYKYYVLGTENKNKIEDVDDLSELLEMVKSGNYAKGGITPYDANLEGDSIDIVESDFAKGGVVYDPKNPKIEKLTITRTGALSGSNRASVIGRYASTVSELQQIVSDYIGTSPQQEYDYIVFRVNDNTRGYYYIELNKGKKNTVKNVNPETLNSLNFKRVIDAKTYLVLNYDWTDFFELGSQTSASTDNYVKKIQVTYESKKKYPPIGSSTKINTLELYGFLRGLSNGNYENINIQPIGKNNYGYGFSPLYIKTQIWVNILLSFPQEMALKEINRILYELYPQLNFDDFVKNSSTSNQNQYPEYYEYIGDESYSFSTGKIYKIRNPKDIEAGENFIDNDGTNNGFSGENYKKFKPSTEKAFLAQQGGGSSTLTKAFDFSMTKIDVSNNPDLSLRVQKKAFEDGWEWENGGGKTIDYNTFNYLYFTKTSISYGNSNSSFSNSPKREITEAEIFGSQANASQTPTSSQAPANVKKSVVFQIKIYTTEKNSGTSSVSVARSFEDFFRIIKKLVVTKDEFVDTINLSIFSDDTNIKYGYLSFAVEEQAFDLLTDIEAKENLMDSLSANNQELDFKEFFSKSQDKNVDYVIVKEPRSFPDGEKVYRGSGLLPLLKEIYKNSPIENIKVEIDLVVNGQAEDAPLTLTLTGVPTYSDYEINPNDISEQILYSKLKLDWFPEYNWDRLFPLIDLLDFYLEDSYLPNYTTKNINELFSKLNAPEVKSSNKEITLTWFGENGETHKFGAYFTNDATVYYQIDRDNFTLDLLRGKLDDWFYGRLSENYMFPDGQVKAKTPTSNSAVPKIVEQGVYNLDLAVSKLEKASSVVVTEYNKDIYDQSLKFLYDTKATYELALKFTPESAFMYERLDILKKLADIEKKIKNIEDMKKGGAFYMLAKILEKLERGENWKQSETAEDVITNKIPQSEIDIIIRSQKFKNWFGDWEKALVNDEYDNVSKALTEGIPTVYHHGARRIKYTYREVSNGVLYLAENISYAVWFSQNATAQSEEGNYLTECFVNVKNPIDLTAFKVNKVDLGDIVRYVDAVYPMAKIYDYIPAQVALLIKTNQPTNVRMWAWQLIRSYAKFVNHIKENTAYDGFLYYENNPSDEVVNPATGQLEENVTKAVAIFKSHQVKVVDAVLFDGGLDDWRFENGGKIKN